MRMNLRKPCHNCPFATAPTRIRFRCRDRAEELEESAYRNGFPCHLSAEIHEDDDGESGGYVAGAKTQHCAGAIGMFLNGGYDTWPGIGNRELRADYSSAQRTAFASPEAFFEANEAASFDRDTSYVTQYEEQNP